MKATGNINPILITSIPRSGSSMIAGIFDICGAASGVTTNQTKPYTQHLFENQSIRSLVSYAFHDNLCDERGQFPLPAKSFFLKNTFAGTCHRIMEQQGAVDNWQYKDSRLCLIWEELNKQFPEAKWIVVMRDEKHILNSCQKTAYMTAFNKSYILDQIGKTNAVEGWKWWLQQYKDRILEMQYSLNLKFIYPEKMGHGNFMEIKEVIEWAGLEWKDKEVRKFITPKLRRI